MNVQALRKALSAFREPPKPFDAGGLRLALDPELRAERERWLDIDASRYAERSEMARKAGRTRSLRSDARKRFAAGVKISGEIDPRWVGGRRPEG